MTAEQILTPGGPFLVDMPRTARTLPILDNLDDIRIASPCSADWNAMTAVSDADGARARFCGFCEKNVYDLSSMTRADALALIERHEGRCCVRFYKREDGTVLTEDCPVGFRAALKRAQLRTLAGIASCASAVAAAVGFLLGTSNPISQKLGTFETVSRPEMMGVLPQPMMGAPPPEPAPPPMMGEPAPPRPAPDMGRMVKTPPPPKKKVPKVPAMGKPTPTPEDRPHVIYED